MNKANNTPRKLTWLGNRRRRLFSRLLQWRVTKGAKLEAPSVARNGKELNVLVTFVLSQNPPLARQNISLAGEADTSSEWRFNLRRPAVDRFTLDVNE